MKWFSRSVGCFQIIYYNISFFSSNIYVRMLVWFSVYWSIFSVFFCNFFFTFKSSCSSLECFRSSWYSLRLHMLLVHCCLGCQFGPLGIIIVNRKTANNLQLRIEITFTMLWVFLFHIQRNLCTWNPSTNYWFETI